MTRAETMLKTAPGASGNLKGTLALLRGAPE